MKNTTGTLCALSAILALTACGSDSTTPWASDKAVVYSADGTIDTLAWDGECVELENGECVDLTDECGDKGTADVYLDEKGNVAEVICYPPGGDDNEVITLSGNEDEPPEITNGAIVVIEGGADAPAQSGDLLIEENNLTIWGDDPAGAVIDGDFTVNGNNWLISGVTVTGNLIVNFNDTQLTNCVIEGNLVLEGNNTKVAGCRIEGNIEIKGNNSSIVNNDVSGNIQDEGGNTECSGNYRDTVDEAVACE